MITISDETTLSFEMPNQLSPSGIVGEKSLVTCIVQPKVVIFMSKIIQYGGNLQDNHVPRDYHSCLIAMINSWSHAANFPHVANVT